MKTRSQAWALLTEWTKSEALVKHALAVEAALRWYAGFFHESEEIWAITGLLHDFDYERYPNVEAHPFVGCRVLEEQGYPEEIISAILGHATYSGVRRETKLAKTLFACDELAGLVSASVLVRPDRSIHNLTVQSVKKKMKDKAFARAVSREDIRLGAEELGVELDQHIDNVIKALRLVAADLALAGGGTQ